eukprot:GHRR01012257.1.p1 GENE.GHRR01012257.1~~GHRR01012257.1.p1  ORF type:complete len:176 (-),score=27.38 GHRR01012257.1:285-812(-)
MALTYVPSALLSQGRPSAVLPVKARSVPRPRVTCLWRLVSCAASLAFASAVKGVMSNPALDTLQGASPAQAHNGCWATATTRNGWQPPAHNTMKATHPHVHGCLCSVRMHAVMRLPASGTCEPVNTPAGRACRTRSVHSPVLGDQPSLLPGALDEEEPMDSCRVLLPLSKFPSKL